MQTAPVLRSKNLMRGMRAWVRYSIELRSARPAVSSAPAARRSTLTLVPRSAHT